MVKVKVKSLIWDEWNRNHIKKHKVSEQEVDEVCKGVYKQQPAYNQRYLIFCRTQKGRRLTVVLARERKEAYYVITARDMSSKERRMFARED